jgi:hypothetical protein
MLNAESTLNRVQMSFSVFGRERGAFGLRLRVIASGT